MTPKFIKPFKAEYNERKSAVREHKQRQLDEAIRAIRSDARGDKRVLNAVREAARDKSGRIK